MNYDNKVNKFHELSTNYILYIINLIDFLHINNILPKKILLFLPIAKQYINENKLDVLNNSILHKNEIINFTLDDFNDEDDNQTLNTYKPKFENISNDYGINICDLLIDIKNKSKNISKKNKNFIKKNINEIIKILNEIQKLF